MTAHLAIQSAIVSALQASPAVASVVRANSVRPLAATQPTAAVVRLVSSRENGVRMLGGPRDWTTTYQVEVMARGTAAGDPVAALDGVLDATWQRLNTVTAANLGAMDVNVQADIRWEVDDLEVPVAAALLSVIVMHRTDAQSLNSTA